jgi:S-methylmethionine-dependent homocysteine/selenocysteine methylase
MSDHWRTELTQRPLIIDGGTGAELRRRGFPMHGDVWSALAGLTHYELLRSVHGDYLAAGADVVTTNTFATTRFVLAAAGYEAEFETINRRAVDAAREARELAGRDVTVAGSLSCLPPRFHTENYPAAEQEAAAYQELADLLAAGGVDVIALEMLEDTEHARLACAAARATGLPVWAGLSCRLAGQRLVAFDFPETTLTECLDTVLPFGPEVISVMHSPASAVEPALNAIREAWSGWLGAYPALPSDGERERDLGTTVTPEALGNEAVRWLANGARLVGGCCGATPAHIAAVARALGVKPAAGSD